MKKAKDICGYDEEDYMEDIQISVIMPCYNDGRYIMEAIESVNLSYNLTTEIVVIDDGSDDPLTRKILSKLNHDRVRLCHTQHIGPSGARNHGIEQARGEFILPLDADDRIEHTYIHRAMKELQEHEQYGAVYCYADLFGREKGRWKLPAYSLDRMLLESVVFVTAMFRKSDWESVGGFRMDMEYGLEDYDFFLSILEAGKEIYQIPEVLFHYRIKRRSRTTRFVSNKEHVKKMYRDIYIRHRKLYQEHMDQYVCALRDELIEQKYKLKWLRRLKAEFMRVLTFI